jgi:SAM-dependent methyltransferase
MHAPPNLPSVPPTALRVRDGVPDRAAFHHEGWKAVRQLERLLASERRTLESSGPILEFGCGAGMIIRHLGYLAEGHELYGVDADHDLIAWCSEHLPNARFEVVPSEPPLRFPPGTFDLIFTRHEVPLAWLPELQRLLEPGGRLVANLDQLARREPAIEPSSATDQPTSWKGFSQHRSWPAPDDRR